MPRAERKNALTPVAAPPHTVCAMLCVRDEDIRPAIDSGEIPVYRIGARRRIVIEDAVRWLRTNPQAQVQRRGVQHG